MIHDIAQPTSIHARAVVVSGHRPGVTERDGVLYVNGSAGPQAQAADAGELTIPVKRFFRAMPSAGSARHCLRGKPERGARTRPVSSGELRAAGTVVHRSRNLILADSVVHDSQGRQVARGSGSFMRSQIPLTPEIGYR
jgi:hypothetical protein